MNELAIFICNEINNNNVTFKNELYPNSSYLLAIIRCLLQFNNINIMIKFLNIFIKKIENKKIYFIKSIVRIKNGWKNINNNNFNYFDIKINKIIIFINISLVSEIQFLPLFMIEYKLKIHSSYSIIRLNEFYNN